VEGADAGELAALRARERAALDVQAPRPLHVQAPGADAAGAPGTPGAPGPAAKKPQRRRARKARPRQTATLDTPASQLSTAAHPTSRARQEVVAVARAGLCARRRAVLLAVFRTEAILVCSCCGIPRCTFRFP